MAKTPEREKITPLKKEANPTIDKNKASTVMFGVHEVV